MISQINTTTHLDEGLTSDQSQMSKFGSTQRKDSITIEEFDKSRRNIQRHDKWRSSPIINLNSNESFEGRDKMSLRQLLMQDSDQKSNLLRLEQQPAINQIQNDFTFNNTRSDSLFDSLVPINSKKALRVDSAKF